MGAITQGHVITTVAAGVTVESNIIDAAGFRRVAIGLKSTQNGTIAFKGGNRVQQYNDEGAITFVVDQVVAYATAPLGEGISYPTVGARFWKLQFTNTSATAADVEGFILCEDPR